MNTLINHSRSAAMERSGKQLRDSCLWILTNCKTFPPANQIVQNNYFDAELELFSIMITLLREEGAGPFNVSIFCVLCSTCRFKVLCISRRSGQG